MAKVLSNIQDIVELTLFHAIRRECVDQGYLPDIVLYPNTTSGAEAYEEAISEIASKKGFSIEVFNNSNTLNKGLKKAPRIVLVSENFMPGSTGLDGSLQFLEVATGFLGFTTPNLVVDYAITVRLIANSGPQLQVLNSILANALPSRGYISAYIRGFEEDPFNLFIEKEGYINMGFPQDDLIERGYRFVIPDLMEVERVTQLNDLVAKINQITLETQSNNVPMVDIVVAIQ